MNIFWGQGEHESHEWPLVNILKDLFFASQNNFIYFKADYNDWMYMWISKYFDMSKIHYAFFIYNLWYSHTDISYLFPVALLVILHMSESQTHVRYSTVHWEKHLKKGNQYNS